MRISCPHCGAALSLTDDPASRNIRCSKCRQMFVVPGDGAEAPSPATAPAPVNKSQWLILGIAIGAGGSLILLGGVGLLLFLSMSSHKEPAIILPAPESRLPKSGPVITQPAPTPTPALPPKPTVVETPADTGPAVPPFTEPANPYRAGTQTKLRLLRELDAPGGADQLVYSARHELLFLRNSGSAVWVVDVKTGQALPMEPAEHKFSDLGLAPDESALFVADFGGEVVGYSKPAQPSWVHRFDLSARSWEKRQAPKIAYRLETVDAWRFLLLEQDQWVELSLNRWERGQRATAELARIHAGYGGDLEYDPRTGRAFHGSVGSSSAEVHVFRVVGDALRKAEETGTYGSASKSGGGGSCVLSRDGKRFYYGALQVEALDVTHNLRTFPEVIVAGSRDLAFGKKGCYHAEKGDAAGSFDGVVTVCAVASDGLSVWTFDGKTKLRQYAIEGER